ncbi:MAG: hypothetical protein PHN30_04730 [Bacteroidales bacterium]|nr:hypothetical protein [Bacteroidales bacterium]MDD3385000.1 hypothetical protein [Bacteroidales bacterium]
MKALKKPLLISFILIIVILGILMVIAMKAQDRFVEDYLAEIREVKANKTALSYPDDLLERKTSLEARLQMAKDDSIGLRINLKEKMVYLEIQGIVLHRSPILRHSSSYFFRHLNATEKYILFHKPLRIQNEVSTIPKEQFIVKIAPKDSSEVKEATIPDTIHTVPVMYRFNLNHGLRLQVTGQLADSIPQFWPRLKFDLQDRAEFIKALIQNIFKDTKVPYRPTLRIRINSREAEAIYRAIPRESLVILEL